MQSYGRDTVGLATRAIYTNEENNPTVYEVYEYMDKACTRAQEAISIPPDQWRPFQQDLCCFLLNIQLFTSCTAVVEAPPNWVSW